MAELEEGTLQVGYRGAEITKQVLEKLFASTLREIEKAWGQEKEKTKVTSLAKKNTMQLGKEVHTPDIDRAANGLQGKGVRFQVLKQPGQPPEYTLVFKGRDMATVEKALKSLNSDRAMEKTTERAELAPPKQGHPGKEIGKSRIFTGKDLKDDIRMARQAVKGRNAARAVTRAARVATRALKAPDKGLGR